MTLVCMAIWIFLLAVFVRIVMSWLTMWYRPTPGTAYAQVYDFFESVTEPVLAPVRAMLPPMRMGGMGLDLSPIVVFLGGQLLLRLINC